MSVSGISNSGFNFGLLNQASKSGKASPGASFDALALRVADFRSQTLGALMSSDKSAPATALNALLDSYAGGGTAAEPTGKLSASGRNNALFDPESGYQMMSLINKLDVTFKAQFAELSEMKSELAEIRGEAQDLADLGTSTDNAGITTALQEFVGEYNEWVERFDADMKQGGALAGVQAAEVSRYELDQSIKNPFNGAHDGLGGLRDLGFSIDPHSGLASLDTSRLASVLNSNRDGALQTVHEFSANFAKSAELLNSTGNFIPNRLNNLDRVIDYIDDNKSSLQAEFGLGDAARPSGQIAQALAAYQQMYAS